MRIIRFTDARVFLPLLVLLSITCILPKAVAQEVPAKGMAAAKEVIKEIKTKLDQLERLVDDLDRKSTVEPNKLPAAPSRDTTPTAQAEPVGPVTWLKCTEWWSYGGMKVTSDPGDASIFVLNGTSNGGLGISKEGVRFDEDCSILVVRVLDLGQSNFTRCGRMLKVTVGGADAPLTCNCEQYVSEGDRDFVVVPDTKVPHRQGAEEESLLRDYSYDIRGKVNSAQEKIVLAFYVAEVKNLHLKIGFAKGNSAGTPGK